MSNFIFLRRFWNLPSGHQKGNGACQPVPAVTSPYQSHPGSVWWKPVSPLLAGQFFAAIILQKRSAKALGAIKTASFYAFSKLYSSFVKTFMKKHIHIQAEMHKSLKNNCS